MGKDWELQFLQNWLTFANWQILHGEVVYSFRSSTEFVSSHQMIEFLIE